MDLSPGSKPICIKIPNDPFRDVNVLINLCILLPGTSIGATQIKRNTMAKVTGIGGVFIKAKNDDRALASWYEKHLGLKLESFGGAVMMWDEDTAEDGGMTVWNTAKSDGEWFSPSQSPFLINYRVDDMAGMIQQLEEDGIEIIQGPEYHENGAFAWLLDPEGNKVELWEPKIWDEKNKRP